MEFNFTLLWSAPVLKSVNIMPTKNIHMDFLLDSSGSLATSQTLLLKHINN